MQAIDDEIIGTVEAAKMLDITPQGLRDLVRRGDAPPCLKVGKYFKFRRQAVLDWIEEQESALI